MQNEKFLRHPDVEEMKSIFREAEGLIKMVTIAPELPGGMELLRFLKEQEVVVAVAHSDATYEEAKAAFTAGASHVTHCFNGMRPIHHRDQGLVVAAFEEGHSTCRPSWKGFICIQSLCVLCTASKDPRVWY